MSYIGNSPTTAAFLVDTFSGTGSQTAFTMTVAPANTSSIIVAITGVLQDPSTYSVSGTTLTFSAAPPSGTSNISVRYLGIPASGVTTTAYRTVTNTTATAGQTSFTIPSYTVGYVDVYRNGVYLPTSDYTATTGTTVVLNNAATAGDTITTISFYVSSVLNAIPATAGSVSTSYLVDGSVTQAKLGTGVAGNGPAFSAYQGSTQSLTGGTSNLVTINTEEFDTASCYNNTGSTVGGIPAYGFLPNVAGYYQINLMVRSNEASGETQASIWKNGAGFKGGTDVNGNSISSTVNAIIYLNGTSDYVQPYCYVTNTTTSSNGTQSTWFQAVLVRSA